ncbi:methyltransferase [Actinocatenispora thailandica]|uniref:Methyltransferase n=1 Tax=Actinocatenispora thailandica TaxID=227318 RepID=A0A7R7HYT8_9ACTN|nr:class I SAM-dependent methyltransferase [Actinocatenispora thailandica]BCJ36428.1 methyltransferase [Actinocatenispora thailandica]
MDGDYWDERYRERGQLWSGRPNGVLVDEASALPPGRALDVGCGEGADARWLAGRGWQVTAIDISAVALERAAASTDDAAVTFTQLDLATTAPPRGSYQLVSAQYFPLPRQPDHAALRRLLAAVGPGGTLLVAGHDVAELPAHAHGGPDPADFYRPDEIAAILDDGWTVLIDEVRPRVRAAPPGTAHTRDAVLVARRR